MPRLLAYYQENHEKHATVQTKPEIPLPISKSKVSLPISMAKLKYRAFIKHLKGRSQETKATLLKNITITNPQDKVKKFIFKFLPKSLPSPVNYTTPNITFSSDKNAGFFSNKRFLRGKAKKSKKAELDPYLILRLSSPKTSNSGEPSKIQSGHENVIKKVRESDVHIKNKLRYRVGRKQETKMAFKLPSKPTFFAFNLFCKKKVMALTQTRRITHYSSNGNDGRKSENSEIEEQRLKARKGKGIAVKAMKKVNVKRVKEGDGDALWKKKILIGARCQPQDFKGALQYDEKGNQIMKVTKTQLPSETMDLNFHMGEGK